MSAPLNADLSDGDPLGGDLEPALPGARSLYYMAVERELWPAGDFAGFFASLQGIEEPVDAHIVDGSGKAISTDAGRVAAQVRDAEGEVPVRARLGALASALEASKAREEALAEQVAALETGGGAAWEAASEWREAAGLPLTGAEVEGEVTAGVGVPFPPVDSALWHLQVDVEITHSTRNFITLTDASEAVDLNLTAEVGRKGSDFWRSIPIRFKGGSNFKQGRIGLTSMSLRASLGAGSDESLDRLRARIVYQPAPTP